MSHLDASLTDLDQLAEKYPRVLFVAFGGAAYAFHFGDSSTKDFDVLFVGANISGVWEATWTETILPFFKMRGYAIYEHRNFNRRRAIDELGQSHVRRYGIVAYKTVVHPEKGNMIDINFADSRLFDAGILKTPKWHQPIPGHAVRVITRNRLALDVALDLHSRRNPQKIARAAAALQKLREETVETLPPGVSKRISRALETTRLMSSLEVAATIPQFLLTGVSLATPWLEERGVHAVLKGGTVSTQYAETLETDDIDVQLYRVAPVRFEPLRTTMPADPKTDEIDWATYYDGGMVGAIVGFMIFMVELLRTVDARSLAATITAASGSRVSDVNFGIRISHPPRPTKHITLLSIDMFITVPGSGVATHPLFDCVLGDVRDIPSETHFERNGALKMHDSATIDANFVRMLEIASPVKEEKRLKRFLEKKLGANAKRTRLGDLVIRGEPPLPLHSIPSATWRAIRDEYVASTNARSKTAIGRMLAVSESVGGNAIMRNASNNNNNAGNNNAMNVDDAIMTLENAIRQIQTLQQ